MRRLTSSFKKWLRLRAQREMRRRRKRHAPHVQKVENDPTLRDEELAALVARRASLPSPTYVERQWLAPWGKHIPDHRLQAPGDFSLRGNYAECLAFVEEIRHATFVDGRYSKFPRGRMRSRFVADLAPIRELSLEGALVIAAEFDRIRRVRGFRPNLEDEEWAPWLRSALRQLGLYRLVNASNRDNDELTYDFGLKFVPFITGRQVESEKADELLQALKAAAGDQPDYHPLYDGLVEAISNVRDHAYEEIPRRDGLYPHFPQWWAAGAFDPRDQRLELSVYDQGLGIPHTIKSKTRFAPLLATLGDTGTDAERIALALEYGRSSANEQGRGNGLWRMAKLVDSCPGSTVQILSGNGRVTYAGAGDCKKDILQSRFCGTLVHWDLAMPTPSQS